MKYQTQTSTFVNLMLRKTPQKKDYKKLERELETIKSFWDNHDGEFNSDMQDIIIKDLVGSFGDYVGAMSWYGSKELGYGSSWYFNCLKNGELTKEGEKELVGNRKYLEKEEKKINESLDFFEINIFLDDCMNGVEERAD